MKDDGPVEVEIKVSKDRAAAARVPHVNGALPGATDQLNDIGFNERRCLPEQRIITSSPQSYLLSVLPIVKCGVPHAVDAENN